jgi:hypothetical protein
MAEQKNTRTIVLAIILVIALAGAGAYVMMSRGGQDAAPDKVAARPAVDKDTVADGAPAQAEKAAPTSESYAPAANAPLTLTALQYMPEKSQLSYGIPGVESLLATVAPLAQELLQDEMNVSEELGLIARDLAADMGVEESDDLAAVLTAMGLDTGKGIAVFANFDELAEELLESASAGTPPDQMPDISKVKAVAVIPVVDSEKAEASLKKLTGDMLSGVATSEESAGEIVMTVYEGIGAYFVTDTVLALGNDLDMLKEAAAHEGAPALLRYGSESCPPDDIHEAAMLIHGAKIVPLIEKFAGLLENIDPASYMMVQTQMEKMKEMYADSGDDPLLVTLSVRNDVIELKSKIDSEVYPTMLASMGAAKPLRWAQLLPTNTLAFLSLAFTPEAKQQIKDVYLENLPDEIKNSPGYSQAIQFGMPALDMLGQEITLGITGMDPIDFPSLFLFVELANAMQANILLPMVPQIPEGDPYREVQIKAINFPSPIQFYFAMIEDALILSNSVPGMQSIIDLVKDGKTSGFFESLDPPIAPETPIYQALLLKPQIYGDIVSPLSGLSGQQLPPEVGDIFETVSTLFTDMRFFSEMQDNWLVTRISIIRTPLI